LTPAELQHIVLDLQEYEVYGRRSVAIVSLSVRLVLLRATRTALTLPARVLAASGCVSRLSSGRRCVGRKDHEHEPHAAIVRPVLDELDGALTKAAMRELLAPGRIAERVERAPHAFVEILKAFRSAPDRPVQSSTYSSDLCRVSLTVPDCGNGNSSSFSSSSIVNCLTSPGIIILRPTKHFYTFLFNGPPPSLPLPLWDGSLPQLSYGICSQQPFQCPSNPFSYPVVAEGRGLFCKVSSSISRLLTT
jgi:hypothetical protein